MRRKLPLGFTLIEILIVIAILTILFTIALIAINPARQSAQARNTKRQSDVTTILDAVQQYATDNRGVLPIGIQTSALIIQKAGGVDLCAALIPTYIAGLPVDPQINGGAAITDCASSYTTNYMIASTTSDNRVNVTAPGVELGATISVTR